MMPATVKGKLHEYIEHADEKKIQAIYTLVENDIEDRNSLYDEATINSFRATSADYFAGKIKAYPMQESLNRIREKIRKIDL
jgi:hypothetical protein